MYDCGTGCHPGAFSRPDGSRLRARYGLGDGPVVGYVGRMEVDKGVPMLIEAMRLVWRSNPRARLLLAGRDLTSATRDHDAFRAGLALDPPTAPVSFIDGFGAEDKTSIRGL
jgi:glycosyltransferase involved in cell wall biosynthesis